MCMESGGRFRVTVQLSVIASGFCEATPIVVGSNRCEAISESAIGDCAVSTSKFGTKKPCLAMTPERLRFRYHHLVCQAASYAPSKLARRAKPIYNSSASLAGEAEGEAGWVVKI